MKKLLFSILFAFAGQLYSQCTLSVIGGNFLCAGECTVLTASWNVSGPTSYTWLPSGPYTDTNRVCPTVTTTYTVCSTTQTGCTQCKTITVTAYPLPVLSIQPHFASGCPPICLTYSNTSTATGTCHWDFGDSTTSNQCNPTNCWTSSGSYSPVFTLTDFNGCTNRDTVSVAVYEQPTAAFTYSLSSCCNDAFFTDSSYISSGTISAWHWSFHGGYPASSTNQNPGTIMLNYGVDTVCLKVTSAYGCLDSICHSVNETIMSIKELNDPSSISIYPNPARDHIYIEANTIEKLIVDLYDIKGRHVFNDIADNRSTYNISHLDEGVYTLTIKTRDLVINKKLVILR